MNIDIKQRKAWPRLGIDPVINFRNYLSIAWEQRKFKSLNLSSRIITETSHQTVGEEKMDHLLVLSGHKVENTMEVGHLHWDQEYHQQLDRI